MQRLAFLLLTTGILSSCTPDPTKAAEGAPCILDDECIGKLLCVAGKCSPSTTDSGTDTIVSDGAPDASDDGDSADVGDGTTPPPPLDCTKADRSAAPTTLASVAYPPSRLLLVAGSLVWYRAGSTSGSIMKVSASGGTPTVLAEVKTALGAAIATDGSNVFWTDSAVGAVYRCPVSGCDPAPVAIATSQLGLRGLTVSASFAFFDTDSGIVRCATTGCGTKPTPMGAPRNDIDTLLVIGDNLLWQQPTSSGPAVMHCPTTGCSGTPSLFAIEGGRGLTSSAGRVFWLSSKNTIASCPATGCGPGPEATGAPTTVTGDGASELVATGSSLFTNGLVRCDLPACTAGPVEFASGKAGLGIVADDTHVFWIDPDRKALFRCSVCGCEGAPRVVATEASGVAYDPKSVVVAKAGALIRCLDANCATAPFAVGVSVDRGSRDWSLGLELATDDTTAFWADSGAIRAADFAGSAVRTVATTSAGFLSVNGTEIRFVSGGVGTRSLYRVPKSGGTPSSIVSLPPSISDLLTEGSSVYYGEATPPGCCAHDVKRRTFTGDTINLHASVFTPRFFQLVGTDLYWAEDLTARVLRKSAISGAGSVTVLPDHGQFVVNGATLYYTTRSGLGESSVHQVLKVPLGGGTPKLLASNKVGVLWMAVVGGQLVYHRYVAGNANVFALPL